MLNDIKRIGVEDRKIDLFEGQYAVPDGMRYNSYVITDDKIAVFDTVEKSFTDEWLKNLGEVLDGRNPDYLIISHMEPDHSANIDAFLRKYPDVTVAASAMAFIMMKQFYGLDVKNRMMIKDGVTLSLGRHELKFYSAPMVHWPEVTMTYDATEKVLFSADAFGKFGASDNEKDWLDEARKYYFGIVGKYGAQVQSLLKKFDGCEISAICPLHGPVIENSVAECIGYYSKWSAYEAEEEGVTLAYTSVYGHTAEAVKLLAEDLGKRGCKVAVFDLARCDTSEALASAFRYDKLVLATTTYNTHIFPFMNAFIEHLTERNFRNRKVAFIENGTWVPQAMKIMSEKLKDSGLNFANHSVTIKSALNEETARSLSELAAELTE